jgi:hypothetical protein
MSIIDKIFKFIKSIDSSNAFAIIAAILIMVLVMFFVVILTPEDKPDYAFSLEIDTPE